jgi:hypothetical protein
MTAAARAMAPMKDDLIGETVSEMLDHVPAGGLIRILRPLWLPLPFKIASIMLARSSDGVRSGITLMSQPNGGFLPFAF